MDIIVCVKQTPGVEDLKTDPDTKTLIREGVPGVVNPDDRHAVEEALRLVARVGGKVVALSLGPPQAQDALREVYAMGADEVVLLCDPIFAGSDTRATAYALAQGVRKIGDFDLILCGRRSTDGETGQTGPQLAEILGIPQVTEVRKVEPPEDDGKLTVERVVEDGAARLSTPMPCLLTVVRQINKPRHASIPRVVAACRELEISLWTAADVGADPSQCGLAGSPTRVVREFAPAPRGGVEMVDGDTPADQARWLVDRLQGSGMLS